MKLPTECSAVPTLSKHPRAVDSEVASVFDGLSWSEWVFVVLVAGWVVEGLVAGWVDW